MGTSTIIHTSKKRQYIYLLNKCAVLYCGSSHLFRTYLLIASTWELGSIIFARMFSIIFNIICNIVAFNIHWALGLLSLGLWIRKRG